MLLPAQFCLAEEEGVAAGGAAEDAGEEVGAGDDGEYGAVSQRAVAGVAPHLRPEDADLAGRIDAMTRHTDQLRQDTHDQRTL